MTVPSPEVERAVHQFTTTQLGLVTRSQLATASLGRSQVRRLIAEGRLRPCGIHTLSIPENQGSLERRALAAALDADAAAGGTGDMQHIAVSHITAAGLLITAAGLLDLDGFRKIAMKQPIALTILGGCALRRVDVTVHTTQEWRATDLRRDGVVPRTSGLRTVIDLAGLVDDNDLGRALDSAERDRLLTVEMLHRCMARLGPRRGVRQLRRVLDGRPDGGIHSVIERLFFDGVRARDLPVPESQVVMRADGRTLARVDFFFRTQRLVAEVSGHRTHSLREQRRADAKRARELLLLGYEHVEYTSDELFDDLDLVLDELAKHLAMRS